MITEFRTSFARDLKRIKNKTLFKQIQDIIQGIEEAQNILEIKGMKKLQEKAHYYRIRLGDYRIGLIVEGDKASFVRILHRREIYRHFP